MSSGNPFTRAERKQTQDSHPLPLPQGASIWPEVARNARPPTAGNFQQMALLSALPIESNASHHSTKAFVIPFTPIKPAFRCVSRAADRRGEKWRCANQRAGELRKNGPTPTFDLPLHFVPKSCLHKGAIYVNPKGILKLTRQCDKLFFRKTVLCPSSGRRFEGRKSPPHRASLNPTR